MCGLGGVKVITLYGRGGVARGGRESVDSVEWDAVAWGGMGIDGVGWGEKVRRGRLVGGGRV